MTDVTLGEFVVTLLGGGSLSFGVGVSFARLERWWWRRKRWPRRVRGPVNEVVPLPDMGCTESPVRHVAPAAPSFDPRVVTTKSRCRRDGAWCTEHNQRFATCNMRSDWLESEGWL